VAALAAVALTACTGQASSSGIPTAPQLKALDPAADGTIALKDRQPAPELSGMTLDGKPLAVSDYRGKVVVLNFWASWCGPCRDETPALTEVATRSRAAGVQFVGVNVKDQQGSARAFERAQKVPYPSLYDQPGRLLLRFRSSVPQSPPTTLVLDRQGRIAASYPGQVRLSELLPRVQQIAAET